MNLISIEHDDRVLWPVLFYDDGHIEIRMYYDGDKEAIENDQSSYFVADLLTLSSEEIEIATQNNDILHDRDLITIKSPIATGVVWKQSKDNPLYVEEAVTGEVICQVQPGLYDDANAKIIAASRALLKVSQGVYNRLATSGAITIESDPDFCEFIVYALREAGVSNVTDLIEYED